MEMRGNVYRTNELKVEEKELEGEETKMDPD